MSMNPVNLLLRFLLEMAALVAMGYWGWSTQQGIARWLLGLGLPLVAAIVWGTFRVPNDPGKAPVAVPGIVRLLLEATYFGTAVALLAAAGVRWQAVVLGTLIVLHYVASYDRALRFLKG
ncbi:MAG: YrdB family protein [Anaerolineae bacterium]